MILKLKKLFWKIITLNGRFFTKKKAIEIASEINTTLKKSKQTNVNVSELIIKLGGINNITDVSATVNTLLLSINNLEIINLQDLQKLGAKGCIRSDNKLKIVFGDDSAVIADLIVLQKNHSNN